MSNGNKSKLIVGLLFVIIAFVCLAALFYYLVDANRVNQEKLATLQVQLTDLINEKASPAMSAARAQKARGQPLLVQDRVKKAEDVYGEEVRKQREGFLWIDKEASSFMVTLGALNGLSAGSRLAVYDGDQKIDEVVVENVLDVLSYARPVKNKIGDFQGNYYRVVIEGAPPSPPAP